MEKNAAVWAGDVMPGCPDVPSVRSDPVRLLMLYAAEPPPPAPEWERVWKGIAPSEMRRWRATGEANIPVQEDWVPFCASVRMAAAADALCVSFVEKRCVSTRVSFGAQGNQ